MSKPIKCSFCELEVSPQATRCPSCGQPAPGKPIGFVSSKTRLVAAALCLFLGWFGVHRFYVGKKGTGFLQLITWGGLGLWSFFDFIMILRGSFKDNEGKTLVIW